MRILIIEDEKKTAAYLRKGLTESGFFVDVATNGLDGLHQATTINYDVVLLDVMLPEVNGWQIMQKLRETSPQTRVVFVTARDQVEDRVKGLELGADDYLVKPFAFSELRARIHSIMRRQNVIKQDIIKVDDLTIDLLKHKAMRSTNKLNLSPKEFALLALLVQHKGHVLTRTFIAERVWDIHFDCDTNVVDVAIRRLRQKVDDGFSNKLIQTVRGVGYVLEAYEEIQ